MGTFTSQIPRDIAKQMGREAVTIGEMASYQAPSGRIIDLKEEIAHAVQGTKSYPPDLPLMTSFTGEHSTYIEVTNETTLSAAIRLVQQSVKTVVLNFASATNPGGGFLSGARAQEEYLARSTCLYQCIRDNPMYAYNRANYSPFYSDYMLYSTEVTVIRGDDGILLEEPYAVSIITAAAVNANQVPAMRRQNISLVMWKRILRVLAVGVTNAHDGIVLGAWGCGAFGNDGTEIAGLFRKALESNFRGAYRRVTFAIVDWSSTKRFIRPFEEVFRSEFR
ncbi:MAG: TIGR02452 family protein [Anaerolineaceae bacterium]